VIGGIMLIAFVVYRLVWRSSRPAHTPEILFVVAVLPGPFMLTGSENFWQALSVAVASELVVAFVSSVGVALGLVFAVRKHPALLVYPDSASAVQAVPTVPTTLVSTEKVQMVPVNPNTTEKTKIDIVVPSCFPWLTGPVFSSLEKAIGFRKRGYDVRLHIPWIPSKHQPAFFPPGVVFESPIQQVAAINSFVRMDLSQEIAFFECDVLPCDLIPTRPLHEFVRTDTSMLLMEEAEHMLWRTGLFTTPLKKRLQPHTKVVGIIHTNYPAYASNTVGAWCSAWRHAALVARHCHVTICISRALTSLFFRPVLLNTISLRSQFTSTAPAYDGVVCGFYFIGKLVWQKGFRELCDMAPREFVVDVFGSGGDREALVAYASHTGVRLNMRGCVVSGIQETLSKFKTFVNCSASEGVCTTTIEALAMNKLVILPMHSSNEVFYLFKNVLLYELGNRASFARAVRVSMTRITVDESQHVMFVFGAENILDRLEVSLGMASACLTKPIKN